MPQIAEYTQNELNNAKAVFDLAQLSDSDLTLRIVRERYKILALTFHPDKAPIDRVEEYNVIMSRITNANVALIQYIENRDAGYTFPETHQRSDSIVIRFYVDMVGHILQYSPPLAAMVAMACLYPCIVAAETELIITLSTKYLWNPAVRAISGNPDYQLGDECRYIYQSIKNLCHVKRLDKSH